MTYHRNVCETHAVASLFSHSAHDNGSSPVWIVSCDLKIFFVSVFVFWYLNLYNALFIGEQFSSSYLSIRVRSNIVFLLPLVDLFTLFCDRLKVIFWGHYNCITVNLRNLKKMLNEVWNDWCTSLDSTFITTNLDYAFITGICDCIKY